MSGSRDGAARSALSRPSVLATSPAKRERLSSAANESLVVPKERVFSQPRTRQRDRRWCGVRRWVVLVVVGLVVIGGGIAAVVVVLLRNRSSATPANGTRSAADAAASSGGAGSGTGTGGPATASQPGGAARPASTTATARPALGKDGDSLSLTNGTVVRFVNPLGGTFATRPFDDSARAQSDSPPLNVRFDLNRDPMRGVNLGGWLSLEDRKSVV